MNKNAKELFKLGWKSMLFWTFALGCYAIFRFLGIEDSPGIQIKEELAIQHSFTRPFLVLISIGIVLGVLYAILDFFF
jgi:adenylate cyclase